MLGASFPRSAIAASGASTAAFLMEKRIIFFLAACGK
jgi:hypothetical protein